MQSGEHLWPAGLLPGSQLMTNKTDDTGKGPHRPGDAPKRPYATIDVEATEIGREPGASGAQGGPGTDAKAGMRALPPPSSDLLARVWAAVAAALATAWSFALRLARNSTFLSHATAGVVGAVLTLAVTGLLGLLGGGWEGDGVPPDLAMRLAAVEKALPQRPALPAGGRGGQADRHRDAPRQAGGAG